jgi:HSP20 family protein
MTIRDLIPFHWKKEPESTVRRLPDRPGNVPGLFDEFFREFDELNKSWPGDLQIWRDRYGDSFNPRLNVSETRKEIRVEAELPGMNEKDIDVQIEKGQLRIRGEKKHEERSQDDKIHRMESSYGIFERIVSLPEYAKSEGAKAKFKHGVLDIRIPKDEKKTAGKYIPVSAG